MSITRKNIGQLLIVFSVVVTLIGSAALNVPVEDALSDFLGVFIQCAILILIAKIFYKCLSFLSKCKLKYFS